MPNRIYKNIKSFDLTVIIIFITAVLFSIFFQSNKMGAITKINPFVVDPYDAVGSIAIQICIAVSVLNLARYVSFKKEGYINIDKLTFISRGCFIIILSIASTLLADLAAEIQYPTWNISVLGKLLMFELCFMGLLTLISTFILTLSLKRFKTDCGETIFKVSDNSNSLSEVLKDIWSLLWTFIYWLTHNVKKLKHFFEKIEKFLKALLKKLLSGWLNPKYHPWRFALLISIMGGLIIAIAQASEGPGLVALIRNGTITINRIITTSLFFITIEISAVMSCFFIFGGFLGLRPIIFKKSLYF